MARFIGSKMVLSQISLWWLFISFFGVAMMAVQDDVSARHKIL
jgi:hypothetical protein